MPTANESPMTRTLVLGGKVGGAGTSISDSGGVVRLRSATAIRVGCCTAGGGRGRLRLGEAISKNESRSSEHHCHDDGKGDPAP